MVYENHNIIPNREWLNIVDHNIMTDQRVLSEIDENTYDDVVLRRKSIKYVKRPGKLKKSLSFTGTESDPTAELSSRMCSIKETDDLKDNEPVLSESEICRVPRNSFLYRSLNEKLLLSNQSRQTKKLEVTAEPVGEVVTLKRDSFIRQSLRTIRRSFIRDPPKKKITNSLSDNALTVTASEGDNDNDNNNNSNGDENTTDGQKTSDTTTEDEIPPATVSKWHNRNNSDSSSASSQRSANSDTNGANILSVTKSMAPLQGKSDSCEQQSLVNLSTATIKASTTKSPKSLSKSSKTKGSKNGQPEKEKKVKESSSSRQKKFHRHFHQVSQDERVINYFSCALVSDILLQGHLYITPNFFAFYSNVFGYVTKVLIPIISVVTISKEKTAKIIPNAIGVQTANEKHVFTSFMSREDAYRLMLELHNRLMIIGDDDAPELPIKVPAVDIVECSLEDESSCSVSGNESPQQLHESTSDASHTLRIRTSVTMVDAASTTHPESELDIPSCESKSDLLSENSKSKSTELLTTSPSLRLLSALDRIQIKFPVNFHIVYIGVFLTAVLAIFSGYLFYRIVEIQDRANSFYAPIDFKHVSFDNSANAYAGVLQWQKDMQFKNVLEAQKILNTNLDQIARVRKSLEALSVLIHDKRDTNLNDASANYHTNSFNDMNSFVPTEDSHLNN